MKGRLLNIGRWTRGAYHLLASRKTNTTQEGRARGGRARGTQDLEDARTDGDAKSRQGECESFLGFF